MYLVCLLFLGACAKQSAKSDYLPSHARPSSPREITQLPVDGFSLNVVLASLFCMGVKLGR